MKKNYSLLIGILMLISGYAFAQPTQPSNPANGNESNCTTATVAGVPFEQCPTNSAVFVTNFQGGAYNRGNAGNHLGVGAIWRFTNIGTISGNQINAEVTVNSQFQATLDDMDDNTATDQNGNSVADFFGPKIIPDVNLNATDRRGYVQMTINFFVGTGNFTTAISIDALNFISYDADGSFEAGGANSQAWFRETRLSQLYSPGNPTVLASASSELVSYNYTDPAATTWTGFAGGVYERTGISRCAEVASSFRYGSGAQGRSSLTFRIGYDFKAGTNGYNIGQPSRQYGFKFGCYNFPNQTTLPVKLLSFNGAYKNQATLLNWRTENETSFDRYEIQRSVNGSDYTTVGTQLAHLSIAQTSYQFSDDLSSTSGTIFYYRLKMFDIDGKFKYSDVIMIRKDSKTINGITINPNPIMNGTAASVRFTASARTLVDFKVMDMTGKVVLKQQNNVSEGNNSVSISNLERLQPGTYILQMTDGNNTVSAKFSVVH